jgi:hypothetical protein
VIINILGVEYAIQEKAYRETKDVHLENSNGYCSKNLPLIIVEKYPYVQQAHSGETFKDEERLEKARILRHEIIHAFFKESGLWKYGNREELVDWFAIQYPKISKVFEKANCAE